MSEQYDHVNKILNLYREQKFEEIEALYIKNKIEDIFVGFIDEGEGKFKLYIKVGNQETIEY